MKYRDLVQLNKIIRNTAICDNGVSPIINELKPSQKYLIISSDPSSDTDKNREILEKHSGFEERVISLFFLGSDNTSDIEKIRLDYRSYKRKFLNNFYWTHYSKCYAKGNPNDFWAKKFLKREISLFEPKVIIVFGSKTTDFLFGKGKFKDRINKLMDYNGVSTICSLHPSRDWNMYRRDEYKFYQTWKLIRSKIDL